MTTIDRTAASTGLARLTGLVARRCTAEADWWRIRSLLVETGPDVPAGWNWDVRRWDGWRFHNERPVDVPELARTIALWESPGGRLLGAVHPEDPGTAFLEVRPEARWIEPLMLAWAEECLAIPGPDGSRRLTLAVHDQDRERQAILRRRGYRRLDRGGRIRASSLPPARPGDPMPLPSPYRLRTTRPDLDDGARIADLLNATFGRTVHTAAEYLTFMTRSPSFDQRLNLVAEAPDGTFAAHVGVTLEPVRRQAFVEPVATHPDHRRRGLARVLVLEGLRRAASLGATSATVETGDGQAANALYAACGLAEAAHLHRWRLDLA